MTGNNCATTVCPDISCVACCVLHVFLCSGNYQDSLACCDKAQTLLGAPSHLALGCLGIASQYSDRHEDAIRHFSIARELLMDSSYEVCRRPICRHPSCHVVCALEV
jgi:hypothetical protein